jgi:cytochrome b subunit of formate dehydrogenase
MMLSLIQLLQAIKVLSVGTVASAINNCLLELIKPDSLFVASAHRFPRFSGIDLCARNSLLNTPGEVMPHIFPSRNLLKLAVQAGISALLWIACSATAVAAGRNNALCIGCHTTPGLSTRLPSGEPLALTMDIKSFQASVHGVLNCTDCHTNIQGYPHPIIAAGNRRDFQIERYQQCQTCHPDQYVQALDSNHARFLAAGNRNAAICVDCHDSHSVAKSSGSRQKISTNCGKCHRVTYAEYLTSAHGKALLQVSNPDVPVCTDCHGSHRQDDPTTMAFRLKSPKICAKCHGNAAMMRKYNLSYKVFDTYVADFHGSTVTLFERKHSGQQTNEAVCTDCHGVHNIQRASSANSSGVKENLLATCRRCHADATADFPDSWVGHFAPTRNRFPLVYYVNLLYRILIPVTIGCMALFVLIDAVGRIMRRRWRNKKKLKEHLIVSGENNPTYADFQIPLRFTVSQRIEHALLAAIFTALAFTGLIQMCAANSTADRLIDWLGGIETIRVRHREAAFAFALLGIYHLITLSYRAMLRRDEMTIMPSWKDFRDAGRLLLCNFWLTCELPQMPRYSFAEKLEYWSLLWGSAIMGVTGLLLLNPLVIARYLPSQFIPAAKAAHSGEAILAVLAIIVWHFYNVHIKTFNKSMFTGRLTREQMEDEHGLELKRFLAGAMSALPDPGVMRRRLSIFIPVAVVIAATGIGIIHWAATVKIVPVAALPAKSRPSVDTPETAASSASSISSIVLAPHIPHAIAQRKRCRICHDVAGIEPVPQDHEGRPVESCQICHRPSPESKLSEAGASTESGQPRMVRHSMEGEFYRDCLKCHLGEGIRPFPASHSAYPPESCTSCHQQASGRVR